MPTTKKLLQTIVLSASGLLASFNSFAFAESPFVYAVPTADHPGKFGGEVQIDRIGSLLLPKGVASFSGDELSIRAVPQWLFDRSVVLKGVVVRAEGLSQEKGIALSGLAVILEGSWLNELNRAAAEESINTINGDTSKGRIIGRADNAINFRSRDGKLETIPFSQIKTITSSRAFTFYISGNAVKINPRDSSLSFEASNIAMKPCNRNRSFLSRNRMARSGLSGTEAGISKSALATFVALDLASTLAAPIAIPLVLNAKNQRAAKNEIDRVNFATFSQALQAAGNATGQ